MSGVEERLTVRVALLGPVQVFTGDGAPATLGGPRVRMVAACLALAPGEPVSVEGLIDGVWGTDPPTRAASAVHAAVSRLRKALRGAAAVDSVAGGYRLAMERQDVDALRFEEFVVRGRRELVGGDIRLGAGTLCEALGLWRGAALSDVLDAPFARVAATRFDGIRAGAIEDWFDAEIRLGRACEVLVGIEAACVGSPLNERLAALRMRALSAAGRQADALVVYDQMRRRLDEELGIDPSAELRAVHVAVLRGEAGYAAVPGDGAVSGPAVLTGLDAGLGGLEDAAGYRQFGLPTLAPSGLPPDIDGFTGRTAALAALDTLLSAGGHTPAVGVVSGVGGVGKSGLAVRWSHRVASLFPDGQLFADMRGYDADQEPRSAHEVLGRFLRSLGVPGEQIPEELEDRVALYRAILVDRRVLIVLDNVRTAGQARELLAAGPRCCVLVTGRDRLEEVVARPASARVHLGMLTEGEAVGLLTEIAGEQRIFAARDDAVRVAALCDRLPLALRIAAARLAAKPHWSVRRLAGMLADEQRRLDELSQGSSRVRASFALSYRMLSDDSARLFRRLGLLDAPDFADWVGAALLDCPALPAERLIEQLVDAQLVEPVGVDVTGRLRYRFHDLVRLFARERAERDETQADRIDAADRVFRTYLTLGEQAYRRELGGHDGAVHSDVPRRWIEPALVDELLARPLAWFDAERAAVLATVRQAADAGAAGIAWDLTGCMATWFTAGNHIEDCRMCCEHALAAAMKVDDLRGQAEMHHLMGAMEISHGGAAAGMPHLEEALELFQRAGDEYGQAATLLNIARFDQILGDLDTAMTRLEQAIPALRRADDRVNHPMALKTMAQVELERGRADAAMGYALEAVRTLDAEATGHARPAVQARHQLAYAYLAQGMTDEAEQTLRQLLEIDGVKSESLALANVLLGLGETLLAKGSWARARASLTEALTAMRRTRGPQTEGKINFFLGMVCRLQEDHAAARDYLNAARRLFVQTASPLWQQRVTEELQRVSR